MRMEAAGILPVWWKEFSNDATYCLKKIEGEIKNNQDNGGISKSDDRHRLSFNDLSWAFVILGVGYVLAIIAFIVECTVASSKHKSRVAAHFAQLTVSL